MRDVTAVSHPAIPCPVLDAQQRGSGIPCFPGLMPLQPASSWVKVLQVVVNYSVLTPCGVKHQPAVQVPKACCETCMELLMF